MTLLSISSLFWVQMSLTLTATVLGGYFLGNILRHLQKIEALPRWIKILLTTVYQPSVWLIWGYGTFLLLEIIVAATDLPVSFIVRGRHIFFISMISWIVLRWKGQYEQILKERASQKSSKAQEEALIAVMSKVITIFIMTFTGLIVLDILSIQLTGILAFGGVGGVAIGFAAKDVVANYFGGLMIHIIRPFTVGEWITSPNNKFEGIVEDIGWYVTRIRTFSRRPMYIPNALFIDAIIENPGRMYHRRIQEIIGIRHQDAKKVKDLVDAIDSMLRAHPDIAQDQLLFVHFVAFGTYSLNIEIYCYTNTIIWGEWRAVKQNVFLKVIDLITSHGAQIAFPTHSIHVEKSSAPDPQTFGEQMKFPTRVIS